MTLLLQLPKQPGLQPARLDSTGRGSMNLLERKRAESEAQLGTEDAERISRDGLGLKT